MKERNKNLHINKSYQEAESEYPFFFISENIPYRNLNNIINLREKIKSPSEVKPNSGKNLNNSSKMHNMMQGKKVWKHLTWECLKYAFVTFFFSFNIKAKKKKKKIYFRSSLSVW